MLRENLVCVLLVLIKRTNVWFSTNVEHSLKIKNIDMKGATTATLEYEVGANVYDPGASQDLATLKVRCNGVDLASTE